MPVTTVATSDVLTASHFNTNYRDQVVSTVTSATRPSGTEGQFIYETDTNRLYVYTGSTWELVYQQGGWTSWTPQIDQGATTNIAKTTTYAKYGVFGKTCIANCLLAVTGSGTGSAHVTVSLPLTSASSSAGLPIGSGELYDASSATRYVGMAEINSSTTAFIVTSATGANGLGVAAFTAALASGDSIRLSLMYEVS